MKRIRNSESGNILLLTAILLPVLLGMGALALDAGYYFDRRQRIGAAADAAALAGANEVKLNASISASALATAVRADSALNGFTHGTNNVTVEVNCPPSEGPKAGGTCADGFVEVKVRQTVPGFLMRVLGRNSMDVEDRAVAGPNDDTGCVYALASGAAAPHTNEIDVLTGAAVSVPNCRVISNGDMNVATGATVTAKSTDVSGTCPTCAGKVTPAARVGVVRSADPFGTKNFLNNFTDSIALCYKSNFVGNSSQLTLQPGVYCGNAMNPAIKLNTADTYTFAAGKYYLVGGGLSISSVTSVAGSGVSFYFTGNGATYPYVACGASVVDLNAGGGIGGGGGGGEGSGPPPPTPTITLSAPTSGSTEALLFIQDRNAPNCGTGSTVTIANLQHQVLNLDGVMYFPKEHVKYGATGGVGSSTGEYWDLIGQTVEFTGTAHTEHHGHGHYEHHGPHSHSGHEE